MKNKSGSRFYFTNGNNQLSRLNLEMNMMEEKEQEYAEESSNMEDNSWETPPLE